MLDLHEDVDGRILVVRMTGKLTKKDYEVFVPKLERLIREHGRLRVLCQMHEFHGWTVGAFWEDLKFDAKHFSDIERLALVGEWKWRAWMVAFCKPFTKAEVRYFDQNELQKAEEWIRSGLPYIEGKHASLVGHDAVQEAGEESFPASDPPAY